MVLMLSKLLLGCLPNVWTDGSLVREQVTGVSSSGAHQSEDCWGGRRCGHVDRVRPEREVQSSSGFCSVFSWTSFQSVKRAETWCVILALQSADAVHLDVDNLGVVRHVGRLVGMDVVVPLLLSLSLMVIFFCLLRGCFIVEVLTRFGLPRSKVML